MKLIASTYTLLAALQISSRSFAFTIVQHKSNGFISKRPFLNFLALRTANNNEQQAATADDEDAAFFQNVNPMRGTTTADGPITVGSAPSYMSSGDGYDVSLRKMKMTRLIEELLDADRDAARIQTILRDNQALLLQQFDDIDAPLEPDTIFIVDGQLVDTREGRFRRYREAMNARIEACQHNSVRRTLVAMSDFVLSFEGAQVENAELS